MKNKYIIMNPEDNCATALTDIPKNENLLIKNSKLIQLSQSISMGHKIALEDIEKGNIVKKYGEIIGIAVKDIKKGDWIHVHNIKSYYLERNSNE